MLEKLLKKCYCDDSEENLADKSSESIKTAVLSRIEPIEEKKPMKRKWGKKAVLISAIAFALVGSATAVVAGANGWNLKTAISGLFGEDKNDGSAFFGYDINGIGSKKLDRSFERDGYTVNMVGVVADKYTSYLLYDIVVEDGYVFETEDAVKKYTHTYSVDDEVEIRLRLPPESFDSIYERYWEENKNGSLEQMNGSNSIGGVTTLISQDGNVYHYATRHDVKPLSFENEDITFEMCGLIINSREYDPFCKISDPFTVTFDFVNESEDVLIDVNEPFTFEGETYALDAVELTPLSVYLRISQPKEEISSEDMREFCEKSAKIRDSVKLQFKDGSITNAEVLFWDKSRGGNASNHDNGVILSHIHLMWKHPVNVDDVEAITIGDTTFTLN